MTAASLAEYQSSTAKAAALADSIIEILLRYRRVFAGEDLAEHGSDSRAVPPWVGLRPQWIRILDFLLGDEPIEFALPAFPCKSPNPNKVAGALPDEGERLALRTLQRLCDEVAGVYAPGARLTICSDGHVFADVIGVADGTVARYKDDLRRMMRNESLGSLETFDLEDMWGTDEIDTKRARLERGWMGSIEGLRRQARTEHEVARVIRGMSRFLREDAGESTATSSQQQREARRRAYRVLARSKAWGAIIHSRMPRAVRLSIHPQPLGADKFGVSLIPSAECDSGWTTPWHAVVLYDQDDRPRLVRHDSARAQGIPEMRHGRIWHYRVRPSTAEPGAMSPPPAHPSDNG
ncbi:isocyanide synthase family protein [Mycobacterium stomatepiae]|uniref:Paerucumarin biosynthesis protein PvcA n=1 Tax=Mycobacterium stomatepiae TaxID=470076 RepID=A0A7I7QAW6_9MYCO|nr:isocyanide synthase family protein [Mycobacterium stomatepiae]MCV7164083.1 L-tyrosine/L-tryptophan isonitrile synthase family protein [Mycobacterium stomatepiae]BBY23440.1 paerucumarin biosynthesis protein PvcA [Mycobacterium stomatepiae]